MDPIQVNVKLTFEVEPNTLAVLASANSPPPAFDFAGAIADLRRLILSSGQSLRESLETDMSKFSDAIAAADAAADAAIARVQADVTGLRGQVTDLQQKVTDGTASPDDVARLASLTSKLNALDPTNPTVLPPTDVTTAPPTDITTAPPTGPGPVTDNPPGTGPTDQNPPAVP